MQSLRDAEHCPDDHHGTSGWVGKTHDRRSQHGQRRPDEAAIGEDERTAETIGQEATSNLAHHVAVAEAAHNLAKHIVIPAKIFLHQDRHDFPEIELTVPMRNRFIFKLLSNLVPGRADLAV